MPTLAQLIAALNLEPGRGAVVNGEGIGMAVVRELQRRQLIPLHWRVKCVTRIRCGLRLMVEDNFLTSYFLLTTGDEGP